MSGSSAATHGGDRAPSATTLATIRSARRPNPRALRWLVVFRARAIHFLDSRTRLSTVLGGASPGQIDPAPSSPGDVGGVPSADPLTTRPPSGGIGDMEVERSAQSGDPS